MSISSPPAQTSFQGLNLLITRLCHDFASPLNALGLGLEILASDKLNKTPVDPLVDSPINSVINSLSESCKKAQTLLKLYRLLFNPSTPPSEVLPFLGELCQLQNINISFDESILNNDNCLKDEEPAIILGIVNITLSAMARDGNITINNMGGKVTVEVASSAIQWPALYLEALLDPIKTLTFPETKTILIAYLHYQLQRVQKKIDYLSLGMHKFRLELSF